uniref:Ubiquitin-activating enzyme E1 C-terminal domain-containing protein n=1 Tax=Sphenodon punctatus TaxID=8508 RepID=A0A8D0GA24_SPHPU
MAFILAASRLFAQTHRLQVSGDEVAARQVLLVLCLPPFQPCQGLHIPTTDQELKETSDTVDEERLTELRKVLEKVGNHKPNLMEPIHFEKFCQKTWTCWDRIEVPGVTGSGEEMTLGDLRDHLQKEHGLALRMLLYREAVLYAAFWSSEKLKEQLANRLTELVHCITGKAVPKDCRFLEFQIVCEGEEEDSTPPPVHVQLH